MGKLKEQIAAFFGVKNKPAGGPTDNSFQTSIAAVSVGDQVTHRAGPGKRGTVRERSPSQARIERVTNQVAVLASQSPDVEPSQYPSVSGAPSSGNVGITCQLRPQNGGSTTPLSHVPLHIESATLAKLSLCQREQILRELLTRLQTGTPQSRAAAAESLFSSAEDEEMRHKMSTLGAVRPLVELLKLDDVKGQMFAAYTLSALTSFEASLLDMKECHAIHALLGLLSSKTGDLSKKGALRALGRLARVDDCVYDMVDLGALPVLSDLLQSTDNTIVRRCLITLYFIGADKHDMQSRIGKTEAVAKVLSLCRNCSQPEIQAEAVDVIKVLSRCRECADIIMQSDGISILEEIAQHGTHSKACTCAVKALQRLAELEDARQHIIDTGGQPLLEAEASGMEAEALVQAVRDPPDAIAQASACQSIIDAVREDPAYSLHLADAGVVEVLVPLLQAPATEACDVAAVALAHMSLHEEVRRRVCAAGAIALLVRGLPTFGSRGVEGAAVCLEKLVAMREAADQMAGEPVLPGLLHVIHTGHAQASYFALRTLFLLSGVDSSLLAQLAQPQHLVLLAQRAWHGKCEAQSVALLLLRDLARVHPSQVAAPECGVVTLLIGLQQSPIPEVVQFAQETIEQLVHLPSVIDEQMEQAALETLIQELSNPQSVPLSRTCERALRMLPRGMFHGNVALEIACSDVGLSVLPGQETEPPSVDVLILQELKLAPGQRFLEVGSGSGYLTALAAFIVGPSGSAMGVDISADAVAYAREQCAAMLAAGRFGHGVPTPKFRVRDGGTLLEIGEVWDAIVVCGDIPGPWIKTLGRLLTPCGQMIACVNGRLCCFQPSASGKDGVPIGDYGFEQMTLSRRTRRVAPAGVVHAAEGATPKGLRAMSGREAHIATPKGVVKGRHGGNAGLQPRMLGGETPLAADAEDKSWGEDDVHMEQVMREIEKEQMNGLLVMADDIEVCRTPKGRKCRLGEGGFGVVYKALMNGVDEVAVKLVKAERPSAKDVELFLTEVRTLSKLHHRNIVQFYGACLDPERAMFFVTELMKGGDLYSALRHHPETMRWERLGKKVALDVALGINYLHSRRPPLLHRDLKSPNVLLSEEGVAKIADVGMVRSQVKELVTAQPVMTPLWAAPEVMRHERASVKADIWSYGILIWEIVTGCDITEYQPLAVSRQAGKSPKGKLIKLPESCPAVALKVFNACTSMVPDERPTSQEIVEWLRQS